MYFWCRSAVAQVIAGKPRFTWVGLASCPEDEEPEDRFTPFRPFSAQNGQIKMWILKFAGFS